VVKGSTKGRGEEGKKQNHIATLKGRRQCLFQETKLPGDKKRRKLAKAAPSEKIRGACGESAGKKNPKPGPTRKKKMRA